ncbi:Uma2 family endonuclease [Leptolyngbya sp. FACHB-36]|uniref:Uma2 family endonuclease n=1 Tax=Leptolyngbya sp. FACHB-36 TaxID=2692808 RepID=UPI001F54C6EC|nr:Uma2 family endonuclease [Leptolyngbya sp. FACHB-36]
MDVYVSGNLLVYYEKGNPEAVIAPDAFVIFGVKKVDRRSYKTWENNDRTPDFVLEITSKSTRSQDHGPKKGAYAFLGVSEYFLYDPTGDYLKPSLQGFRLVDDNYFAIAALTLADRTVVLSSDVLQLELRLKDGKLRFHDPAAGELLRSYEEVDAALLTAEQAQQAAEEKANRLAEKLRELGIDPNTL